MERITQAQLDRRIDYLRKVGMDVSRDRAYGGTAITNGSQSRNLSSRGTAGQAMEFLRGMEEGFDQCLALLVAEGLIKREEIQSPLYLRSINYVMPSEYVDAVKEHAGEATEGVL